MQMSIPHRLSHTWLYGARIPDLFVSGYIDKLQDSMMVDVERPFQTIPFDGSSCSRGVQDLPGSAEHNLLDTKWFSSNNNFTYLYTSEDDEIFGKNKENSNTILNGRVLNMFFPYLFCLLQ